LCAAEKFIAFKHSGPCHCGYVQFEVDAVLTESVVCDCPICKRKVAMMALVSKEQLIPTLCQKSLGSYRLNTGVAKLCFCKKCGIYAHHQRRTGERFRTNVGCLIIFCLMKLNELLS